MSAKNVAKNSFFSVFSQLLIILAGFFSQRVINLRLGTELIGLNGVISNIIMVFSVSELGISTAIVYHLYSAITEGAEERIASLMNLYRRAYLVVAGVMAVLGVFFLPFVHLVMKDNHFSLGYIRLIYGLWLLRSVLGYLLSYKRSIIIADQREYLSSLATMVISIFNYASVILFVLWTGSYVTALSLGIVFEVIVNLLLIRYVDQQYPYLKKYRELAPSKEVRSEVFRNVKNLFFTRVSQKLLSSTDNLIMSGFINLGIAGLFSNYCLITQSLINIMQALSGALQPTIGNLVVEKDRERDEDLLQSFTFVFFVVSAVIMAGVAGLASIFVSELWLGKEFVLSEMTVFLCAFNCMLYILFLPIGVYVNALGIFDREKWVAMTAALVNLFLSLVLVRRLEIIGVMLGTTVAYGILFLGKSYICYRSYFQKSAGRYELQVFGYILLAAGEAWISRKMAYLIYGGGGLWRFLLAAMACVCLPVFCNGILFCRSRQLRQTIQFVKNYKNLSKKRQGEA